MPAGANKWLFFAAPVVAVVTAFLAIAVVPYGAAVHCRPAASCRVAAGRPIASRSPTSTWACSSSSRSPPSASTASCSRAGPRTTSTRCSAACAPRPRCSPTSWRWACPGWASSCSRARFRSATSWTAQAGLVLALEPASLQFPAFLVYLDRGHRRGEPHALRPARGRDRARGRLPHRVLVDEVRPHPDGRVRQHDHGRGAGHEPVPGRLALRDPRRCPSEGLLGFVWFGAKVALLLFVFIWLRGTLPRFRYDQLMHFGWKVLVPVAAVWILVTAAGVALAGLLIAMDAILFYVARRARARLRPGGGRPAQPDLQRLRADRHPLLAVRDLRPPGLALHRRAAGRRLRGRDHGAVPLRAHAAERASARRTRPAAAARRCKGAAVGAGRAARGCRWASVLAARRRRAGVPAASTPPRGAWPSSSSRRTSSTSSRPPRS